MHVEQLVGCQWNKRSDAVEYARWGQVLQFPKVDRAAWFDLAEARSKIHKGQVALLGDLQQKLG